MLVSIYIPTHNRRALLEEAVTSVVQQTYTDIEIIVSDDGSVDDTQEYLTRLQKSESRLIVVSSARPSGAPAARNRAILRASGQMITGLDDDDKFRVDRIERFVEEWMRIAENEHVSCLFSQSVLVDGKKNVVTTDRKALVTFSDMFKHNFVGNQIFCPKQHLIDVGLFDERMPAWQDMDLFMRVLKDFGPARLLDEPTYICDVSADRQRISRNEARVRSACDRLIEKYPDQPSSMHRELFLQMFSKFYGINPSLSDWLRLWRWGLGRHEFVSLLRASLRGFNPQNAASNRGQAT
jgi:glycosyltransferase involved in cell wall biosynthesis